MCMAHPQHHIDGRMNKVFQNEACLVSKKSLTICMFHIIMDNKGPDLVLEDVLLGYRKSGELWVANNITYYPWPRFNWSGTMARIECLSNIQHEDVMTWRSFPHYWPCMRETRVSGGFHADCDVTVIAGDLLNFVARKSMYHVPVYIMSVIQSTMHV